MRAVHNLRVLPSFLVIGAPRMLMVHMYSVPFPKFRSAPERLNPVASKCVPSVGYYMNWHHVRIGFPHRSRIFVQDFDTSLSVSAAQYMNIVGCSVFFGPYISLPPPRFRSSERDRAATRIECARPARANGPSKSARWEVALVSDWNSWRAPCRRP